MKKTMISLAAAAAVALSIPALAQQKAPEQKPADAAKTPAATVAAPAIPKNTFYKGQGPTQYLAKDRLIGVNVFNKAGEKIGDIEDLIMGATDNDVQGVIMGVGGFLGAGEKKIGVRYSAIKTETKDGKKIAILDVSKDVLKAVEPYDRLEAKKTVLEKAKEVAKTTADKAKEAGKIAADKAKEVGKAAVDKTKEATDKAKEAAKPKTP